MRLRFIFLNVLLGILFGSTLALLWLRVAPSTEAYDDDLGTICYNWNTLSRPYEWGGSIWWPYDVAFSDAVNAWNASPTAVDWYNDENQTQTTFDTYYDQDNRLGHSDCFQPQWAHAFLNRYYLDSASGTVRYGTAMHEEGHVLGLGHSYVHPANMNDVVKRNDLEHDDVCGINDRYGGTNTCWQAFENLNTALNTQIFLCMDVQGGGTDNGVPIWTWDCNGTQAQRVDWLDQGGGYYMLRFQHSGRCLDVWLGGTANGDDLIQWDCNGTDSMLWSVDSANPYVLRNKNSSKCVDVDGQSLSSQAQLHQWTCGTPNSQKWNHHFH